MRGLRGYCRAPAQSQRPSKACQPGAIERRWTRERVLAAMTEWRSRYGRLPTSYDWSRTHTGRRGGEALKRLAEAEWPASSVVTRLWHLGCRSRFAAKRGGADTRTVGDDAIGQ
jgi:hypothetical protein